uniref:hypothetical protein n=1 Tax=Vibrio cholerae TaxID=666 RepID=UPI00308088F2
ILSRAKGEPFEPLIWRASLAPSLEQEKNFPCSSDAHFCADLHSLAELPEGNFACKIQVYFVRSYKMRILPFREETKNRT